MHITFFISSLDAGGAERVMSDLANHLVKNGYQITLITLASGKPFYALDAEVNLIQIKKDHNILNNLPRFFGSFCALFYMRRAFKRVKSDVIISFLDLMNMLVLISTFGMKVPVIISERTNPHIRPLPNFVKWLRLKLYPLAKKLVIQTETAASYFPINIRAITEIIPNAVQPVKDPKEDHTPSATKLISIGRLDMWKDHKTAIMAMKELVGTHPDLHLTIYGQGCERENLLKLIHELSLAEHVSLPGLTTDVKSVLREADLYIFPTLFEGFPNALCEAMAMGLPVVASDASGNVDVVQDGVNGRLFKAGDVNALVSVIADLIDEQSKRERLGTEAQKLSITYSPERIFNMWEKLIQSVN